MNPWGRRWDMGFRDVNKLVLLLYTTAILPQHPSLPPSLFLPSFFLAFLCLVKHLNKHLQTEVEPYPSLSTVASSIDSFIFKIHACLLHMAPRLSEAFNSLHLIFTIQKSKSCDNYPSYDMRVTRG